MITTRDLLEAIAECQGTRSPNANTAIMLAAFYTILDHMGEEEPKAEPVQTKGYSYAPPAEGTIEYDGEGEFAQAINGKPEKEVLAVFEELTDTVRMLNERLYYAVMRKLTAI